MLDFHEIFDTHFFSNHHIQAKKLEATFEQRFDGLECVSFSSYEGLLITLCDEVCDARTGIFSYPQGDDNESKTQSLQAWLAHTHRPAIEQLTPEQARVISSKKPAHLQPQAVVLREAQLVAYVLDGARWHEMLAGAGILLSADAQVAEKVRWARSSYGRNGKAQISIASNGRFSEFQAMLIEQALGV
jgi:hypothetical protein